MGLSSLFTKKKPESGAAEPAYQSRAEEDSNAMRSRGKEARGERKGRSGKTPEDPVLPEKKRARRRLMGAIALVIAVVVLLPMVLDSEPKPLADDIAIQIPSRDKPLPAAANPGSAHPPAIGSALDPREELITPAPPVAPIDSAPLARGEIDKPEPVTEESRSESKPAAPVKMEPKPVPSAPTSAKPATSDSLDAARAMAILDGKGDAKASPVQPAPAKPAVDAATGKVVLQVAALATKEKIDEAVGKLKGAGLTPTLRKVVTQSGELTRIQLVAANKDEADKLREKLKKLGFPNARVAN